MSFMFVGLLVLLIGWTAFDVARAAINDDPSCAGNVCTGTISVGGQDVDYWYTLNHNDAAPSLKVRFSGPAVSSTNDPVRFKVTVDKPFSTHAVLKDPDPSKVLPPEEVVNLTNTQIERLDASPGASDEHAFTFNLRYASPAPGTISLTLEAARNGDSSPVAFTLEIDPAAPTNRDESESLDPVYDAGYLECADGIDNDLDYRIDCSDNDCEGADIGDGSVCEATESTCNDGKDNDGDGLIDCADPDCNGRPGNLAGTKFCGPENGGANGANCADGFDNDGNGKTDCKDDTPGTGCWKTGLQDCLAAEDTPALCIDNIDNDRDQDYSEDIDENSVTGVDCRDYDCAGIGPTCASSERMEWVGCTSGEDLDGDGIPDCIDDGNFMENPALCFDGLDNDLDGLVDCRDPDCLGAEHEDQSCSGFEAWLPPSPLGTGEDGDAPAFYFNYCDDGIDNDGDGLIDELDPDCQNDSELGRFGECGPVPTQEDYTFLSCSDGVDNDLDTFTDCADSQCVAAEKIGRRGCLNASCGGAGTDTHETDAAACTTESGEVQCGDGFDNDADGAVDCFDADCDGVNHGPAAFGGYACSANESGAECADGADNDGDGDIDCMDSGCQDAVQCAERPPTGWTLAAACVTVSHTTAPAPIVTGGNIEVAHDDRIHVNGSYSMRFTGAGPITSLTITIGDAADPAKAFPFDASESNCSLSGPSAFQLTYTSTDPDVGVIFENFGETLSPLDVTLTCSNTSATPIGPPPETFSVAHVANTGGVVEFGENILSVQVFENDPPMVTDIEIEGEVGGTVTIPVGGSFRIQAIPDDDASGICRCDLEAGGNPFSTSDGNCLADTSDLGLSFANDIASLPISAVAVDGADNESATSSATVAVNVIPSVKENLILGRDENGATVYSYRGGDDMNLDVVFETDTASHFDTADCEVYLYKEGSAPAPQTSSGLMEYPDGDELTCQGTWTVPAGLDPGRWYVTVQTTDSTGDTVRSNAQAFLKCDNDDIGTGDCKDADFDNDGTPEGRYTPNFDANPSFQSALDNQVPTYPGDPEPPPGHACDNCLNFYNPGQKDRNANGIGDACEAGVVGRCKYKWCSGDVGGTSCITDDDCASVGEDSACIVVDQGMCTINCSSDDECGLPDESGSGTCEIDWGLCGESAGDDEGNCCFSDRDCNGECVALVDPFIETMRGQILSAEDILSGEEPPIFNATYCLLAGGEIINFTSESGCRLPSRQGYEIPKREKNFVGTFGILDIEGILGGKYGEPQDLGGFESLPQTLAGGLYRFSSDVTLSDALTFVNGTGNDRGNGLVIVEGDLTIDADLAYEDKNASDLRKLASIGWIVVEDSGGHGGNIFVDGSVENLVGAFFAEHRIDTGESDTQLMITGIMVAESFDFARTYASRVGGAERVTFDARVILNPPPGMADVTRSLPGFQTVPGQ